MPSIFKIFGEAQFRGDATGSGNALTVADSSGTTRFTVANTGRFTLGQDAGSTISTAATITTDVAGAFLILRPNGNGGIIAGVPDNTVTGGNARGNNAVDLQTAVRSNANQVASGQSSVIGGGERNRAGGQWSVVGGGYNNQNNHYVGYIGGGENNTTGASWACIVAGQSNICNTRGFIGSGSSNTLGADNSVIVGGDQNTVVSGATNSVIAGGRNNRIEATAAWASISGGLSGFAYVKCQRVNGVGTFNVHVGEAQTSTTTLRVSITGTGIGTLLAEGDAFILAIGGNTAQSGRALAFTVQLAAIVQTQGAGTLVNGDLFTGHYQGAIKRLSNTTTLVGSIVPTSTISDASMNTSIVTITANDTNESLQIQFTPPTTAASDTVIRVVATVYATEVGRL